MLRILNPISILLFFVFIFTGCNTDVQKKPDPVTSSGSAKPETVVTTPHAERHEVAGVGVGKKGHYGRLGISNYAVSMYFRAQEMISFDLIKHDMQLYEAMNGSAPKTHEEFMEKIIKANRSIQLPELKDGCRYEYNPETKELEVVYPVDN